ncbi:MAG: class I SAM-dependent methyltransferase [Acidobacteriota bacterium]
MEPEDRSPFDDAELYDVLFRDLRYDVDFYLELAREARGPVLEVACGTGRVLLPCLEAGIDIDGVDLYPAMLDVLRRNACALGLSPRLYEGDMRNFGLQRRYCLVIIPFNGFLHNLTTEDQLSTLRTCRAHLVRGGLLVMDVFFPGLEVIAGAEGTPILEHEVRRPQNGNIVRIFDTRRFDRVGQVQRSLIDIQEVDEQGRLLASHRSRTAIRWIYRGEMELLLRVAGFSRREICGGFDRSPLAEETQSMIVFAWKG